MIINVYHLKEESKIDRKSARNIYLNKIYFGKNIIKTRKIENEYSKNKKFILNYYFFPFPHKFFV